MKIKNIAAIFVAAGLAGCAAVPMTPTEFRQAVRQDGEYMETYTVNRPFGDVARAMKKMGDECLNFTLASSRNGGAGRPWAWGRSTFNASPKHAELLFQIKTEHRLDPTPEHGEYYLAADLTPVGAGKTKVDVFYWDRAVDAAKALKGWATGDMLGCADATQMF
jgi:hypothetical protein